jgi:hypothetical protein
MKRVTQESDKVCSRSLRVSNSGLLRIKIGNYVNGR